MRGFTTTLVPALLQRLATSGVSVPKLMQELELPAGCEASPDVPVAPAKVRQLSDLAARALEDPFIGLHVGATRVTTRGAFGLPEFLVRSVDTLHEAFEAFARYARLLNPHNVVKLSMRQGELVMQHRYVGIEGDPGRQQMEFFFGALVGTARAVVQKPWSPLVVWFTHAQPERVDELVRYFGTEQLEFGQRTSGMRVDAVSLKLPVVSADRALREMLAKQADKELAGAPPPEDLVETARQAIREALQKGPPRVGDVARALHLSARTLQRRLEEHGAAFQGLADEVRERAARELLSDPALPLGEVAFRLGYTNLGAFIRAFKTWTGKTPGELRESLR